MVGGWIGNGLPDSVSQGTRGFISGVGNALANGGAQSLVMGQRPDWGAIAVQAFGQNLGNALGQQIAGEDGRKALQSLQNDRSSQQQSGGWSGTSSTSGADSATPAQRQAAEQAAVSAGITNPQQATSSARLEEIVVTGNAWERVQHDYYNRMIQEGLSSGTAALFADNQWDAQRNREYKAGGGRQSFATGFVGAGRSQWNGAVDGQAQLYAGSHGWGAVAQGMFNPLVGTGELLGNTIGLINLAVDRDSAISKRVAGYWESQWDSVKAVGDLFYNAFTGNQEAAGQVTFLALEAGGAALITKRLGVPVRAEGGAALDALSIQGGRGVVTNNALVDSEVSVLRRIAANNSVDAGSSARMARIDELTTANYNRLLQNDLAGADYVYRAVPENMLDIYRAQGSISGRGGSPTYFSLEGGASPLQQKLGAQLIDEPQVLLKIPASELVGPTVPRPFGYSPVSQTIGREYFVNSYPQYGAGGFRQFIGTTNSYSDKLYLIKSATLMRLTYQIRLLTYLAQTRGKKLIIRLPKESRVHESLKGFVKENARLIKIERT